MSLKMPIAWLVRAINSSYLSMPSTLKRLCKPALGEGQKPVDNYVDTSRRRSSYPQASCFSQHQHQKSRLFPEGFAAQFVREGFVNGGVAEVMLVVVEHFGDNALIGKR